MSARDRDKRLGGSRMMRKALGLETRNVANSYLLPVLRSSSATAGPGSPHTATAGGGSFHEAQQWNANMSPKALTALRTTRMLQSLGQKVIFSNDPYVNSAFESLLTTKGSKAAALKRAKRLVGAGAAPAVSEVPFSDALRVCDLERDKSALPTLLRAYIFNKHRVIVPKLEEYCDALGRQRPAPMLQAAALLMQHGYFFAAIKATLSEMEGLVAQHMATGDWDTAAALWNWKDPDRELFLKQFKELKIISYYLDVRKQLRALKDQGVVALRGLKVALSMDGEGAGPEAEELRRGIEDMKRAMSEERQRSEEAAAQLKALTVAGGSRPGTASSAAPLPAIRLNINLTAGTTDERLKEMEAALEAERAEFQRRLEEERATLAAVLAEEKSKLEDHLNAQKKLFDEERQRLLRDMYEQQGADIDQQLAASVMSIEALKAQRDRLKSAGGNGGSRNTSGRNAAQAEEAARLEAAVKLDDELSHVRQLEDEKGRVEAERTALEAAQRMLEAQKSQAELEKAKAEQEKGALQEQIAKTMRMFQEQLAQTEEIVAYGKVRRGPAAGAFGDGT
eukprot:XP_001697985.1 predicted protein [Chlamydomonas reinhardtii]